MVTIVGQVEQRRQGLSVWQATVWVSELVEEGVSEGIDWRDSFFRGVLKKFGDEVDGVGRGARAEDLVPRMRLDLRELEFGVVLVHRLDFLPGRGSEDLDDFDQLVDAALAREERRSDEQLRDDAAERPDVDCCCVIRGAEYELRRAIISRTNI